MERAITKPKREKRRSLSAARRRFVQAPMSNRIAAALNAIGAKTCKHGRTPCFLRCGVRWIGGAWLPIPKSERDRWLSRVYGLGGFMR